ncbi:MAG: hypothetical protein GY866_14940 [Proteobacteria bacterium]|nr:hypothetical protein [Pseudomonadota bacterium]
MILKPTISRILDFAQQRGQFDLNIDELEIHTGHYFIGKSVKECRIRDDHNIIIIAIEKSDRRIITNPGPDYMFKQDDRIVMIANEKEIKSLKKKYKRNRPSIIRPSL